MIAEGLGCAPREVSVIMKLWLATRCGLSHFVPNCSECAPDPPEGGRVAERVTVDQREMRRAAGRQPARMRVTQHVAAPPGSRAQRLPGLKPGSHQALDLPGEVTSPDRSAAEVAPGRDRHPGRVRR